jgi:hypothetical protein
MSYSFAWQLEVAEAEVVVEVVVTDMVLLSCDELNEWEYI